MAITQVFTKFNVVGRKKEDYIVATLTAVTSGIVNTRLHWIEAVSVEDTAGNDPTINIYPNSITASATEDDPGQLFIDNGGSGEIYNLRVIGW